MLEKLFILQLKACPVEFQKQFRKRYQQLKVVDKVTEIKDVYKIEKELYKLVIDKSKIALRVDDKIITIGCFLYNQYHRME